MREPVKEKKKRCPLCQKEYPEKDNYCRTDGQRLEVTDAEPATRLPSGPDDGYAVDDSYIAKPA